MSAPDLNAAKLIVSAMNADDSWSKSFTAIRGHRPVVKRQGLTTTPRVIVCPGGRRKERANKNSTLVSPVVYVSISASLSSGNGVRDTSVDDLTEFESLIHFSEEVESWLMSDAGVGRNFVDGTGNYTVAGPVTTEPAYDSEEAERGVFFCVIEATLEELRR